MSESSEDDIVSLIRRVTSVLDGMSIHYHLTGGIVSSYYGDPRYTQDIDIVIKLSTEEAERLISALQDDYFISPDTIRDAVSEQRMFQALDNETCIKIDFHVGEGVPDEFTRTKEVKLFTDLFVKVASIRGRGHLKTTVDQKGESP